MGEYTPNLNLYKPKADLPAEKGWGTKYNEAMDILDGCARKAYVDGLIAGLNLSQIAIDADKDWNGKAITNMGYIESVRIRPVASETQIRWGPKSGAQTVTVPSAYCHGTAWISATVDYSSGRYPPLQISIAGNVVYSEQIRSTKTVSGVYSIKGGDSISITLTGGDGTLSDCKIGVADEAPLIFPAGVWPE